MTTTISPAARSAVDFSKILKIAAVVLICFGAAVRVRQYQARTSFWYDEAEVLWNVRNLSARQIVGFLHYKQVAPPLFMLQLKAMSNIAGNGEFSMHLESTVCSLIGLGVVSVLAWRLLPAPGAVFCIGLFALARRLTVEYAAMVKQYEGDAMVSALLLLVALWDPDSPPLPRLRRVALLASITIWLSHPTAVVFAGISLVLCLSCLRRSWAEFAQAVGWNAVFLASFVALYFVSIRHQHTDEMHYVWRADFPDWSHPLSVPGWLFGQYSMFLQSAFRWPGPIFGVLTIAAIFWAKRRGQIERWLICLAPIVMAIVPSLLLQYPFNGSRLTLFLMPELFLLVAAGSMLLWDLLPAPWRPAWWLLPLSIFISGGIICVTYLIHPRYESNIRPAVQFVRQHYQPGDAIALIGTHPMGDPTGQDKTRFNGRHLEALCYWPDMPEPLYMKFTSWSEIKEKRFWFLVAFRPTDEDKAVVKSMRNELCDIANEKENYYDVHGGAAYLFERREAPAAK